MLLPFHALGLYQTTTCVDAFDPMLASIVFVLFLFPPTLCCSCQTACLWMQPNPASAGRVQPSISERRRRR